MPCERRSSGPLGGRGVAKSERMCEKNPQKITGDSVLTATAALREASIRDGNGDQSMRAGEGSEQVMSESNFAGRRRKALLRQVTRVCLPHEKTVELAGLGSVILRPSLPQKGPVGLSRIRQSCEEALIECADTSALLLIEHAFALDAVNAILGYGLAMAARSLSRIERGLLHGLLASLCTRLGFSPSVRVGPQDRQLPISDPVVIEIALQMGQAAGHAWLCATDEFLANILTAQATTPVRSLSVLRLELGRTRVPAAGLADAREGDVVVFDGVAALSAEEAWSIHIRRGDDATPASLLPDGIVVVEDADEREGGTTTKVERRAMRPLAPSDPATADAGTEVAAEIACLDGNTLGELLGGAPREGGRWKGRCRSVLLRLADVPWAEGEILAVDGEFAVRITRKLAG